MAPSPTEGARAGIGPLLGHARPYAWHIALVFLAAQGLNLLQLWGLRLAEPLMEEGFIAQDREVAMRLSLQLMGILLAQGLMDWGSKVYMAWIGGHATRALRVSLHGRLLATPAHWFQMEGRMGDTLSRLSADTQTVALFLSNQMRGLLLEPTKVLIGIGFLFYTSPRLAGLVLLTAPLVAWAVQAGAKRVGKHVSLFRHHQGQLLESLRETLGGLDEIHLFAAQEEVGKAYGRRATDVFRRSLGMARAQIYLIPSTYAVIGLALVAIIWEATRPGAALSTGGLVVFLAVLFQMVLNPAKRLGPLVSNIVAAQVAAHRLAAISAAPEVEDAGTARLAPADCQGEVRFAAVSFAYGAGPAGVREVSFTVPPQARVALAGPSGAGKSTLVALLTRLRRPDAGEITVDGQPISGLTLDSWRDLVAVVPQAPALFSATVRDNIALGRAGATAGEVERAAASAYADGFIADLPAGYDTVLGADGSTLSGGQRQRLALARAFLRDAPILVLDEATSHLDPDGESRVEAAIDRLLADRTVLIITHDPRRLREADLILYMEGGRVVEQGPPADLLTAGGPFAAMVARAAPTGS